METPHTILVVDDEQVVREAARRILSTRGFAPCTACDAEEALSSIQTAPPDVVVVDLMLPGLSGIEFLEQIRPEHPDVVVIVTTGYTRIDHAVASLRSGAFDFLPKPFTVNELLGPVHRACRYLDLGRPAPCSSSDAASTERFVLGPQAWAQMEADGTAVLGVTDVFTQTAGPIVRADLPETNTPVQQGGTLARFEAADGLVHVAWSALGGRVLAANPLWQTTPNRAAANPLEAGWLVRILPIHAQQERRVLHRVA